MKAGDSTSLRRLFAKDEVNERLSRYYASYEAATLLTR
jgi:hypothetical protein